MDKAKRITQAERVLAWLRFRSENGMWVSGLEFTNLARPVLSYTKRISELRRLGHAIEKRRNPKGYYEYRLIKERR